MNVFKILNGPQALVYACCAIAFWGRLDTASGRDSAQAYRERLKEDAKDRERLESEAQKRLEKRRKDLEKARTELEKARESARKEEEKCQEEWKKACARFEEEARSAKERGEPLEKQQQRHAEMLAKIQEKREAQKFKVAQASTRLRDVESGGPYAASPRDYGARHEDRDRRTWVRTGRYAVPASSLGEGGWMELGGVSRSSSGSGRSGSAYGAEGGMSGTSIGVRATVIRLGGPDE